MMGLTPRETRERLDAVIEFAELEEFVDLKLKNYSSGMLVRLAFSVMLAGRRRRAADRRGARGRRRRLPAEVRRRLPRDESGGQDDHPRHPRDVDASSEYCHRAMLIDDGKIQHIGDPDEVGRQLPAAQLRAGGPSPPTSPPRRGARRCGCSTPGSRTPTATARPTPSTAASCACGSRSRSCATSPGLAVGFIVADADGVAVSEFGTPVVDDDGEPKSSWRRAARCTVSAEVENLLVPGPLLRPLRRQPRPRRAASPSTSTTASTSSSSAPDHYPRLRLAAARDRAPASRSGSPR